LSRVTGCCAKSTKSPGALSLRKLGVGFTTSRWSNVSISHVGLRLRDALIAQQDRHLDNARFDGDSLGLIDHGFSFALPGDFECLLSLAHS